MKQIIQAGITGSGGGLITLQMQDPESGEYLPMPTRSILSRNGGVAQPFGNIMVNMGELPVDEWNMKTYPDTCIPVGCRELGFNYLPRGVDRVHKDGNRIQFICDSSVDVTIQREGMDVFNDWQAPNVIGFRKLSRNRKRCLLSDYMGREEPEIRLCTDQIRFNLINPPILNRSVQSLQELTGKKIVLTVRRELSRRIARRIPEWLVPKLSFLFQTRYIAIMRFVAVQCNANSFQENYGAHWISLTLDVLPAEIAAGTIWDLAWRFLWEGVRSELWNYGKEFFACVSSEKALAVFEPYPIQQAEQM